MPWSKKGEKYLLSFYSRSLSKKFEELTQVVCKKDPLVVALTETWTPEFFNAKLFQLENYQEVISLCNRKKQGAGVGIFLKNSFEFEILGSEISNATQLFTIFELKTTPQFAFKIVYKPPKTNEDIFIEKMNLLLDNRLRTETIYHIVCREFNIILLNTTFKTSWLVEFIESYDFPLKIHEPPRHGRIFVL